MALRILLTGKTGQVGHELSKCLSPLGQLAAPERHEMDLSNASEISRFVRAFVPHLIVNAGAYTAVDQAEKEREIATVINAAAPATLAAEAKKISAILVHYSTDYVFDGRKGTPYLETDLANPVSVYGETKLAGEEAIRQSGCAHLIFRTAWVYATRGRNFLLTILRLATQREELRIVSDQRGAPTLSSEIARATSQIIEKISRGEGGSSSGAAAGGTYHLTAGGETTWYNFAAAIVEHAKTASPALPWLAQATSNLAVIARKITPISTRDYPTPARRPAYSVLSNTRLNRDFSVQLPDWREQLDSLF